MLQGSFCIKRLSKPCNVLGIKRLIFFHIFDYDFTETETLVRHFANSKDYLQPVTCDQLLVCKFTPSKPQQHMDHSDKVIATSVECFLGCRR